MRGFDLGQIRFDEEADGNAAILEQGHNLLDTISVAGHVQAAFSREFLTLFRDERDHIRFYGQGNFGHRLIGGHLQIELGANEFPQEAKIAILNMAPIFSEVDDNSVSPGQFHQNCGGKGSGSVPPRAWRKVATWSMFTPSRGTDPPFCYVEQGETELRDECERRCSCNRN